MEEVTPEFLRAYACPRPPRGLRILLVPGIFTRWYPRYFARVGAAIDGFRRVAFNTEAPREKVALAVREEVMRSRVPAILLGHSKGPLDAHAALVLHPEIVPRVRALVSIQACFHGTPLADDPPRLAPKAFAEISHAARAEFLARHPAIPVPAVALATRIARAEWPLERTRRYIAERTGQASDGFVAERDAELPGARMVRLDGLDHAAIALPWMRRRSPWDPVRVVLALLALAT